jgi:hypothetical protein
MERMVIESINNNEWSPESLGKKLNENYEDFVITLRQKIKEDPTIRFSIVADWTSVSTVHHAKSLLDLYSSRLHIDSITILATRQQYEEDVNAFQSGVKWEEI